MSVSAPEVYAESLIIEGFKDIITNAATYLPLILKDFTKEYQDLAIAYLTNDFKVRTLFGYAYDPSEMPVFNIVLAGESEGTATTKQMYLGGIVEAANEIPNTEDYEKYGSMWACSISVIVRAEKSKQAIILYSLVKWLFLKNRVQFERYGIMATKFSGSDLTYDASKQPAFGFSRLFKMDGYIMNTVDKDITSDPIITEVTNIVRILPEVEETTVDPDDNFLG